MGNGLEKTPVNMEIVKRLENSDRVKASIPYTYKNCPIPGGGYVTGFAYHPVAKNVFYARTDIGGVYRFDFENNRWHSLAEHVNTVDRDESFPISIALDYSNPDVLYIACGEDKKANGILCISEDKGETFRYESIPVMVHGNLSGRGTGFRLVVSRKNPETLYFASQKGGLLRTRDKGKSWEKLSVPEDYTTFVYVDEEEKLIVCGTAGYTTRTDDRHRGHGLYVSYDGGSSFEKMQMPENCEIDEAKMNGLVPSRYDFDGKYLYITMNSTGMWNYIVDLGYSCDTGNLLDGHIMRYEIENGRIVSSKDITPAETTIETTIGIIEENASDKEAVSVKKKDANGKEYYCFGFGGICSSPLKPGFLVASSLGRDNVDDDCVYRSYDYGENWEKVLQGLHTGEIAFETSYMLPKYNGNRSLIHWLSDIKMNPANPDEVWFNTGSGTFRCQNFTAEKVKFTDCNKGLEETVHINVYAPIDGDVKLVDILGDLGGFAFRDLDKCCDTSFSDNDGNRYITCINADISDMDTNLGIITARGNWRGLTKGGLVVTKDGYETFERIPMYFGISDKIDGRMHDIENPNVNPGWVAMSYDGNNIVWSIANGVELPVDCVISSQDAGKTFAQVKVTDSLGKAVTDGLFKTFSDKTDKNVFYGFDDKGRFYVSENQGISFEQVSVKGDMPAFNFGLIDTINKSEICTVGGEKGVFYISMESEGLWKLTYDFESKSALAVRLTVKGDKVYRVGVGLGREGGDYLKEAKALYMCAEIDGIYGFFRTLDEGKTFEIISNDKQHFGDINSIDGDKRVFGRFFIATGTLGVKYGEMADVRSN